MVEQLAAQLAQLARQARQAARYREIAEQLRRTEGTLLYRRWREADDARARAEEELRARVTAAAQAEALVRSGAKARQVAEDALPALREEDAIAAAVVQRLVVQRDTLSDQETRASALIETLQGRIAQLVRDIDREGGLNRDAVDTIERLEWEARELAKAGEGHVDALEAAAEAAREAAAVLQAREGDLGEQTEDVARLAARYGSAERLLDDSRKTQTKSEAEAALRKRVVTPVLMAGTFWKAEDYHQDYYKGSKVVITRFGPVKQSTAYKKYREACGRDQRVKALWGKEAVFAH